MARSPSGLPLVPDQPSPRRQNHEAEDNAQHQPPKPMQNRQLRRIAAIRRRLSHWPNRFKGQPMSQFKISEGFPKDGPCRLYVAVTPVNLRRFGARRRLSPGETIRTHMQKTLSPAVACPGAYNAFPAAEFIALARRRVERAGDVRFDRVTMSAAGIGDVDCERGAGALHRYRSAIALALPQRGGARRILGRIVVRLAIGAAFANRQRARRP